MNSDKLKKFTAQGGKLLIDQIGIEVLHVQTPHLLLQVAGYLKHTESDKNKFSVYFRGQSTLYQNLMPSLYRGASSNGQKSRRDNDLKKYLQKIEDDKAVLRAVSEKAREGLLQHYGIRTRFIDVVDNVWVALWFACHKAIGSGKSSDYLHFEPRAVQHESAPANAYILLVRTGAIAAAEPGIFEGGGTELIDLRVAVPSQFLRPHAQHGLVVRRAKHNDHLHMDCQDFVVGVIRVSLIDALQWLGDGKLLGIHSLFPPPTYDTGYRELLENAPKPPSSLGAIHIVGA